MCRITGQHPTLCMTSNTTWRGSPNTEKRFCTDRLQKDCEISYGRYVKQKMLKSSRVLFRRTMSIFLYRCLPIFLSPSSCNRSKEKLPTSFSPNTKTSQSTSGVATYGGGDTSQLPPATLPMKSLWSIVPHRKFKRTMVTSILPHKEEAASADSSLPPIGSFKPTSFSWWWFSLTLLLHNES